jgi:hypothetical protein
LSILVVDFLSTTARVWVTYYFLQILLLQVLFKLSFALHFHRSAPHFEIAAWEILWANAQVVRLSVVSCEDLHILEAAQSRSYS